MNLALAGFDFLAADRADVGELQNFVCTVPAKPTRNAGTGWQPQHPRMWEYDAQQTIRRLAGEWRLPCHRPRAMYIARDPQGIAAVAAWEELEGPRVVQLEVVGVAMRHRRQKGLVARTFANAVLSEMEQAAVADNAPELFMQGEIYHANDASEALMWDKGFRPIREHPSGARTWTFRLPLADTPLDLD